MLALLVVITIQVMANQVLASSNILYVYLQSRKTLNAQKKIEG